MLDVEPQHLATLRAILHRLVPDATVLAYGSRVSGTARPASDLDMTIIGDAPLSLVKRAELRQAFEESDLPFRVDFHDWHTTDEAFRRIIRRQYVCIQGREEDLREP